MNYLALALSVASLAGVLYVYIKFAKRIEELEFGADDFDLSETPKTPNAPRLPSVRP